MKRVSWTDYKEGFRYELYSNVAGEFIKMVRTELNQTESKLKIKVSHVYLILRDKGLSCSSCHFYREQTSLPKGECVNMCRLVRKHMKLGWEKNPIMFLNPLVTNRPEFVYNSLFINSYWRNK